MTDRLGLPAAEGRLAENVVHFVRALRGAGVKVGPSQTEAAVTAVARAGFSRRVDFYHTLRATLIARAEDLEVYHQLFRMFWRDPEYLESMIHMLSPTLKKDAEAETPGAAERRAADAFGDEAPPPEVPERETLEVDARLSTTDRERLRAMDFEQMSAAELAEAERAVRALVLPVPPVPTRRPRPMAAGRRIDRAATLRAGLRRGGEVARLHRAERRTRPPNLVALCDISGSMSGYSRMLLRFLHAMARAEGDGWAHVHAFTFGTRLTNVSRALDMADPDAALARAGRAAEDWEGGTRIGATLARFNRDWSRRVLGQGAVVLLITDGLERGDTGELARAAERLRLSCRRLIWLNPLLRFDGFEARARGVQVLTRQAHVTARCHSLDALDDLAGALNAARGV